MNFGDILNQWEKKGASSDKKKSSPMEAGLQRYGVFDKDAECDTDTKHSISRKEILKMPFDKKIDLHNLTVSEAEAVLDTAFERAVKANQRKILIVHGKGTHSKGGAVLMPFVQKYLDSHPHAGMRDFAKAKDGGKGATWVLLK